MSVEEKVLIPKRGYLASFEADETIDIFGQVDGRILRVLVEEGQQVEEGQIVVELDKRQIDTALREVKSKDLKHAMQWVRDQCNVRSLVAGEVLSIHVRPGQNVGGLLGAIGPTKMMTIMPKNAPLSLQAKVNLEDASFLKEGSDVLLEARGASGPVPGWVRSFTPQETHALLEFEWDGELTWTPKVFQMVKVDVQLPATKAGPVVPLEALRKVEDGWVVLLSRNKTVVEQAVELGMDEGEWVQVLEGLSLGDTILVGGAQ